MDWIKQTDPQYLPGWVCPVCGTLVVTLNEELPPPDVCKACGAGGDAE